MSKNIVEILKKKEINLRDIIGSIVIIGLIVFGVVTGSIIITKTEDGIEITTTTGTTIELADENVPALVDVTSEPENDDTDLVEIDLPTVQAVDHENATEGCPEGEECGRGWYVDTFTPELFYNATYGQCVDTDGWYGSQCWDLGNLFWQNYAGRNFSTCGTGGAKGSLNCYAENAGKEFVMVWDAKDLRKGDWVIFTNGTYGHVGMAMGPANNGFVALYGTNQGGKACSGGGSTANVVNMSLSNFGGAFRPTGWDFIFNPVPKDDNGNIVLDGKG